MDEDVIALLIPIFAVLGAFALAIYGYYIKLRSRELIHEERKIALEKGLPLPEEFVPMRNPETAHKNAALINRKTFVILFCIGMAFLLFVPDGGDQVAKSFGGVLTFVSFAFLIISAFKYKMSPEEKRFYESKKDYGNPLTPSNSDE